VDAKETSKQSPEEQARLAREAVLRALAPGHKIGRFVIQKELGSGTFGVVFRARDTRIKREVAIKVPRGLSTETCRQFLREARAASRIEHANVCRVYDIGLDREIPYIVSQLVRGGTLARQIGKSPNGMAPASALDIALKIAKGVSAAHAKGVVHRDLKPGNVLCDLENDDILITDFGLAKVLGDPNSSSGNAKGALAYMSPEQFGDGRKAGTVGPLSDVYVLGIILYELLTGSTPFAGRNQHQMMFAHFEERPDRPSSRRADLGTRYDELCLKAIEKKPENRYASAKAFADRLEDLLRPLPVAVSATAPSTVTPRAGRKAQPTESNTSFLRRLLCWWNPPPEMARARAEADNARGDDYYFGRGCQQDPAKAREWYTKAAARNHPEAQFSLGSLYSDGRGVPQGLHEST
jgi:serine/threonine-protein kinase